MSSANKSLQVLLTAPALFMGQIYESDTMPRVLLFHRLGLLLRFRLVPFSLDSERLTDSKP